MGWEMQTLDRLLAALSASDELDEVLRGVLRELGDADLITPAHPGAAGYTRYTATESHPVPPSDDLRDLLQAAQAHEGPYLLAEGLAVRIENAFLRTNWKSPVQAELLALLGPRLEAAFRRLEIIATQDRHLRMVQDLAGVGYWEYDLVGGKVSWSLATRRILGSGDREPGLETLHQLLHPDDRERQRATFQAALKGEVETYDLEFRVLQPTGETRFVHSSGRLVRDRSGRARYLSGVVENVTERRLLRSLLDHCQDGIEVIDARSGRYLDVNRNAHESHGYTREEYLQLSVTDTDELAASRPWAQVIEPFLHEPRFSFDSRHRRKDGSTFPVHIDCTHVQLEQAYLLAVVRDLSERDRSHTLLQAVVEGTTDVVFVKDLAGRYLLLNGTVAKLLGRDPRELIGLDDFALFPPPVAEAVREHDRRVLESGQPSTFEQVLPLRGELHTFLCTLAAYRVVSGEVIGVVGVCKDITEGKALEEQLRQSQKMEAVGQLAGGVAHDFNNLLTVINSYSQMMLETGELDREQLTAIHQAGSQAADLTRRLLAFSRKQLLQPIVVDLGELLPRVLGLLQRLLGEDIELCLEAPEGPARVKVDVGQFEQAIINLAVNGRDAMPSGGKLTIGWRVCGDEVEVTVSDTGQGMEEEVRARIFEPFFTTKECGRGTGLGLAMVYGFVRQSGGTVEVESQPGQGATFRLRLAREAEPAASSPARPDRPPLPRGEGTVLLVEDEAGVRKLARRVLQSCGYQVLEAEDGEQGLQMLRDHHGPLDLVVSDVVMPRMGGVRFAEELAEVRPGVPFLFVTGYSGDQLDAGESAFLQKPFSPYDLAEAVHRVLAERVQAAT